MDGAPLILLGILIALEVLGLPILVVLYLSERARVAQRLNALTQELVRLRTAMAGKGTPVPEAAPAASPASTSAAPAPAAPSVPAPAAAASAPPRVITAGSDWAAAKSTASPPKPARPRESLEERV